MKQLIFATTFFFFLPFFAFAANIDATNKYARFLNTGTLINFGATNGGVTVTNTAVTGYAWSSAAGWINLAPTNGGVVNDGNGVLSGYAWGENTGWINFKPASGGVTIDSSGNFNGYAWSESRGWIVFNCSTDSSCGSLSHKVQTTWAPTTTLVPVVYGGGGIPSLIGVVNGSQDTPLVLTPPTTPEQIVEPTAPPSVPTTPETLPPSGAQVPPVPGGQGGTAVEPPTQGGGTSPEIQNETPAPETGSGNTSVELPAFQESIFGTATRLTDSFIKSFSSATSFLSGMIQGVWRTLSNIGSINIAGVSVRGMAVTALVAALALFIGLRMRSVVLRKVASLGLGANIASLRARIATFFALLVPRKKEKKVEVSPNDAPLMPQYIVPPQMASVVENVKEELVTPETATPVVQVEQIPPPEIVSRIEIPTQVSQPTPVVLGPVVNPRRVDGEVLATRYPEARKEEIVPAPVVLEEKPASTVVVEHVLPTMVVMPKEEPAPIVDVPRPVFSSLLNIFKSKQVPIVEKKVCKETKFQRLSRRFLRSIPKPHMKISAPTAEGKHIWNPRPPCGKD